MTELRDCRGIVVRMLINPVLGTFKTCYRSFAGEEWGWVDKVDDAFVFAAFSMPRDPRADAEEFSAEAHAAGLKRAGATHVHAVVFTRGCQEERAQRARNQEAAALASAEAAGLRAPAERVAVRPGDKIQRRIREAKQFRSPRRHREPSEVFANEERRHLA